MASVFITAATLLALSGRTYACDTVRLKAELIDAEEFHKLPYEMANTIQNYGRPAYVSSTGAHYLYFTVTDAASGTGAWIINDEFGASSHAIAFVNSWAVEPYLVDSVADLDTDASRWHIIDHDTSDWNIDRTMKFECIDPKGDQTIYFESSRLEPTVSGFYVQQTYNTSAGPVQVHSRVKDDYGSIESRPLFLYKMGKKWMFGENVGMDDCLSFIEDEAEHPHAITSQHWNFAEKNNEAVESEAHPEEGWNWVIGDAKLYSRESVANPDAAIHDIYSVLRFGRSIKYIPTGQTYITLRNEVPMPVMGLGTGGLGEGHETLETVSTAMRLGYRLFDLAREYGNELTFSEVLHAADKDETLPLRDEVFIESKVWPTELGFVPTLDALDTSLEHLDTNYVDLYLLHWPECDESVEWMHCETKVDPEGTWRESWRALERAYAEGKVMSIGVSNFDVDLLNELLSMAVVKPHVIQNFAEPGRVDVDVRRWCREHEVLYQPYASIRNLNDLPDDIKGAVHRIAASKNVSAHSVVIRSFLQSGSGVIPRSSKEEHLKDNLNAFSYELTEDEMAELGWHEEL